MPNPNCNGEAGHEGIEQLSGEVAGRWYGIAQLSIFADVNMRWWAAGSGAFMENIVLFGAVVTMVVAILLGWVRTPVARRLAPTTGDVGPVAAQVVVVAIFTATAAVAAAMTLMLFSALDASQPLWVTVGFPVGISAILLAGAVLARFFAERFGEAIYTAFNGPAHPEENPSMYAAASSRWWWIYVLAAVLPLTVLVAGLLR